MNELYKSYADLDLVVKKYEAEKETLRAQIVEAMKKEGVDKQETSYGSFSIASRSSYIYTDAIKKLKEKVKIAEFKEIKSGKAEEKKTEYLLYKLN